MSYLEDIEHIFSGENEIICLNIFVNIYNVSIIARLYLY